MEARSLPIVPDDRQSRLTLFVGVGAGTPDHPAHWRGHGRCGAVRPNEVRQDQVSDARLEEIIQEDMSRYRAMIGQPVPLFGSPFADADGNVWLPSYRPAYPREGSPYTVISPDGEWLGTG